jgi:hypothetical protein
LFNLDQIEEVKRDLSFRNDRDLAKYLDFEPNTIENWKKHKFNFRRSSKPIHRFKALVESINELKAIHREWDSKLLREFFDIQREALFGKSILSYILDTVTNTDGVGVVVIIVRLAAIRTGASEIDPFKKFTEQFGAFSVKSCQKAALGDPDLISEILISSSDPIKKAMIIESLPYSEDERYVETIEGYLEDISPFVREAAITGLHSYAESSEELADKSIFPILRKRIESETYLKKKLTINRCYY